MKFKRTLITLLVMALIYGVGHFYFTKKTPAMLKLAVATIEKSGLKVDYTKHKSGNYLFRPYVELAKMSVETPSGTMPALRAHTESPTRFMLNWWQGQSLTITNKGQSHFEIVYPHFQYTLTPSWLVVTVDKIDTEPSFRNMDSETVRIDSQHTDVKNSAVIENLHIEKIENKNKESQLVLSFQNMHAPNPTAEQANYVDALEVNLEIPESIKNPFQAKWFVILAQNKEAILVKKLSLKWKEAVFHGQGNIEVDADHLPHITLQTSMSDFETFLGMLHNHPLIHPIMLKTWQAVLSILKATSKEKVITFEYKSRSIYINGIEALKNVDM